MRAWGAVLAASAVALWAGPALGHGQEQEVSDQLAGSLMAGQFTAAHPGPLGIVPLLDHALACGLDGGKVLRAPVGADATVSFAANTTHVAVAFDLDPSWTGYAGVAIDTGDAVRALILMKENAVALHRLLALVHREGPNGTTEEFRTGVLGLPYELPGQAGHGIDHPLDGGGVLIDYDREPALPGPCATGERAHVGLALNRSVLPGSLAPGSVVHAVVLVDPNIPHFLPRPVDNSTNVLQINLYLVRPGEDADLVRRAFDGRPGFADWLSATAAGVAAAWVARRG